MGIGPLDNSMNVLLNLSNTQSSLATLSTQLSSGLRITTAADDPSGLAIAGHLQTVVNGLQQGQQEVQNANNALAVADGAMSTVTDILQRIRSLVVEANSTINSASDVANIQAEITQLTAEINTISQNTNFNGKQLFTGSLTDQIPNQANVIFVENQNTDAGLGTSPPSGPALISTDPLYTQNSAGSPEQTNVSVQVTAYDPVANLVTVVVTAESPDPAFGPPQVFEYQATPGTSYPVGYPFPPNPGQPFVLDIADQNGNQCASIGINNVDAADVGKEAIITTVEAQTYTPGSGLYVNTGGSEGQVVQLQIGAMSAQNLGISTLAVGSDDLTNESAEGLVDYALQLVNTQRAQLGGQEVSLNEAGNNAAQAIVQQVAAESSIRDLNVGQAATQFTKLQVLNQVGTSVLSQMQVSTKQITSLLIDALVA